MNRAIVILLALSLPVFAGNNYWTNAPSTGYVAGDTNHLYGTFTNSLVITNSGTVVSPIMFQFEAGSIMEKPTWNPFTTNYLQDNAAISASSVHDVIIDGAVIRATDNGNIGGKTFTNRNCGIWLGSVQNFTIRNCTITNLGHDIVTTNAYVNPAWDGTNCGGNYAAHLLFQYPVAGGDGIRIVGGNFTNLLVHNNFINWAGNGIILSMDTGTSRNIQLYSNACYRSSWGIGWLQQTANNFCYDARVWANHVAYQTNYNGSPGGETCSNPNHQDGMIISCSTSSGFNTNMWIYRNMFGPFMSDLSSADLYQETTVHATNWQGLVIADNVFDARNTNEGPTSILSINGDGVKILNNTFVSHRLNSNDGAPLYRPVVLGQLTALVPNSSGAASFFWTNNLLVDCSVAVSSLPSVAQAPKADYNAYFWPPNTFESVDVYGDNGLRFGYVPSGSTMGSFLNWTNIGCDLHGFAVTNEVYLNSDLSPQTNSPAVGAGINQMAFYNSIGMPAVDFNGNPRPATGPWTIGAIESGSEPEPPTPPNYGTFRGTIFSR